LAGSSTPPWPRHPRYLAVPSSLFREVDEPLRTFYAALLARALVVYRVEEIVVYKEGGVSPRYLVDVMSYLSVPQYLRKKIFPRKKSLKYVGVAPPIAAPSHPRKGDEAEYREGLVVEKEKGYVYVDAGLGSPIRVKGGARVGDLVLIKKRGGKWVLENGRPPFYWRYTVSVAEGLGDAIKTFRGRGAVIVATSRKGRDVRGVFDFFRSIPLGKGVALLFGLWARGLYEVADDEGFSLEERVDAVVNFIPGQGARTVRTLEAVHASLAIVNVLVD